MLPPRAKSKSSQAENTSFIAPGPFDAICTVGFDLCNTTCISPLSAKRLSARSIRSQKL